MTCVLGTVEEQRVICFWAVAAAGVVPGALVTRCLWHGLDVIQVEATQAAIRRLVATRSAFLRANQSRWKQEETPWLTTEPFPPRASWKRCPPVVSSLPDVAVVYHLCRGHRSLDQNEKIGE